MIQIKTREELEEIHSAEGVGCKCCDSQTTEQGWWECSGDFYCFTCALMIETECGGNAVRLPTREQLAENGWWGGIEGIPAN
jgi:hypothetical protein